jgi:hypothetical protein
VIGAIVDASMGLDLSPMLHTVVRRHGMRRLLQLIRPIVLSAQAFGQVSMGNLVMWNLTLIEV